jgi:hypothetical protein
MQFGKGSVIQFLYESDLIHKNKCIVDLSGADLSEANLSPTSRSSMMFMRPHALAGSMEGRILQIAERVSLAELMGPSFQVKSFLKADSSTVTMKRLEKVRSLKGATMPDGSIHPQIHNFSTFSARFCTLLQRLCTIWSLPASRC